MSLLPRTTTIDIQQVQTYHLYASFLCVTLYSHKDDTWMGYVSILKNMCMNIGPYDMLKIVVILGCLIEQHWVDNALLEKVLICKNKLLAQNS